MQQTVKMDSFGVDESLGESFLRDFNLHSEQCSELLQAAACELLTQCMCEIRKCGKNKFTDLSDEEIRKMCFPQILRSNFLLQVMGLVGYWYNDLEYVVKTELMRIGIKTLIADPEGSPKCTSDIIYDWIEKKTGVKFE